MATLRDVLEAEIGYDRIRKEKRFVELSEEVEEQRGLSACNVPATLFEREAQAFRLPFQVSK